MKAQNTNSEWATVAICFNAQNLNTTLLELISQECNLDYNETYRMAAEVMAAREVAFADMMC